MLYLTEQDVVSTLNMRGAIDALNKTLAEQGLGHAKNLPKAFASWGDGSAMHALGSVLTESGYAGFKTWLHTRRGGGSVFSLFDADQGRLLALIEARALGMLRTAAIGGVATALLAPKTVRVAALIGTGPQALTQLAALAEVTTLDQINVFSPTEEKREAFVQKVAAKYDFRVVASRSLEQALDAAEIVTLITRASEPFVCAAQLSACRHLNALGAILPGKAEFAQDVLAATDLVVVDDIENARTGSRELREHFGNEDAPRENWNSVQILSELLATDRSRPDGAQLTVFKGMGMGLSDLALARAVYESALTKGLGQALAPQTRENLLLNQ